MPTDINPLSSAEDCRITLELLFPLPLGRDRRRCGTSLTGMVRKRLDKLRNVWYNDYRGANKMPNQERARRLERTIAEIEEMIGDDTTNTYRLTDIADNIERLRRLCYYSPPPPTQTLEDANASFGAAISQQRYNNRLDMPAEIGSAPKCQPEEVLHLSNWLEED